ncbi:hypothetical protein P4O66_000482, partial [Electrophorus voltai]
AWYWYPFVSTQMLDTEEKTTVDPTQLNTPVQAPLDNHVLSVKLSAIRDEMMKWSEDRARNMEAMLTLQRNMQALRVKVKNINSQHQRQIFHLRSSLQAALEQLKASSPPHLVTEPANFSSGKSSSEDGDYPQSTESTRAFAVLYLLMGTAWYSLTSGISLLDVFLFSRRSAGVRKALLLLLFLLLWVLPEVYPVNCRAVRGSQSFLVIALSYPVQITHVTLEHIPRNVSPTGHINSTPKDFTVHYFYWAAKQGNSEIVRKILLLSQQGGPGVDVNIKSYDGYTPLHMAAIHSHESVLSVLVRDYGANCNIRDNSGKKPYQYLHKDASPKVREMLGDPHAADYKPPGYEQHFSDPPKGLSTWSKLFQSKHPKNT